MQERDATQVRHGRRVRLARRFRIVASVVLRTAGVLQYIASVACLAAILLYVGFEPDAIDRHMIIRVVWGAHIMFIIGMVVSILLANPTSGARRWRYLFQAVLLLLLLVSIVPEGVLPDDSVVRFLHTRAFRFAFLGLYSTAEICYGSMQLLGQRTNPSLILSVSFIIFILIGSFVLMLPKCTVGPPLRYVDSLFMAASAVSMTGMATVDTAATFTPLGWAVMAVLMQIGALGVLTFTSFFAMFFSGRTSIYSQILMRDFIYSKTMSALVSIILYILSFTLVIELAGAVAIYLTLPEDFLGSWGRRAAFSLFHSLSAFCNCGFTTLPDGVADPALMNGTPLFYVVMIVLILAGGIGFPNLVNFRDVLKEYLHRIRARVFHKPWVKTVHVYDLNTKLVLIFTAVFFIGGSLGFYLFEYNHALAGMSTGEKIMQSMFCSATVRTAGFVTVGPQAWLGVTFVMALFMMWVGCASQSMGGGIKINAFAAVVLNLRSIVLGQQGVSAFRRTISPSSIRRANAVVCFSIFAILFYACTLMLLEPELPAGAVAFEAFSAVTTVGMSFGITPELGDLSKCVLATAMFLGRVGIISVLCGIIGNRPDVSKMLPSDDIIIN